MDEFDVRKPIVWTRMASPSVWEAVQRIDYSLLVYHVVDNFPHNPILSPSLRRIHSRSVDELSRSADVVFASSRGLARDRSHLNDHVYFFPNGVDLQTFDSKGSDREPLASIPRPILGFVGTVSPPVDFAILADVARARPGWSLVFVGPVTSFAKVSRLKELPNVHFVGPVRHDQVSHYARSFDVGLIPYEVGEFTRYTFPSKMAEYLSVGVPILSSMLPEVQEYESVVNFYSNVKTFIDNCDRALKDRGMDLDQNRQRILSSLSWDGIVEEMEIVLSRHIARQVEVV